MKPRHLLPFQFSRASLMSALSSVLSLFPKSHLTNPKPTDSNPRSNFVPRASPNPNSNPDTDLPEEKKSLAVATGEAFLGLASFFIKNRAESERRVGPVVSGAEVLNGTREKVGVQSVIWEQSEKDVQAEREKKKVTSPGFSFSAAGLLIPYHLGAAQLLIEKGYIKETTPLAGSSAGAIVCAVIASGNTMEEALNVTKTLSDNCRTKGTAFRLGAVLRDVLEEFLPEDAHIRSSGRIRVAVTQLGWRPRGLLVDQFDSKEDLINAVFTSSFIPGYLAPRPATFFRKRLCIDGGLTLFMPPTAASETVRICAFPVNRIGIQGIGISPDCNPENRASPRQLFNWALEPASEYMLDKFYELGYLDAAVWADQNPVESTVRDEDT